jgi:hypothetical protein
MPVDPSVLFNDILDGLSKIPLGLFAAIILGGPTAIWLIVRFSNPPDEASRPAAEARAEIARGVGIAVGPGRTSEPLVAGSWLGVESTGSAYAYDEMTGLKRAPSLAAWAGPRPDPNEPADATALSEEVLVAADPLTFEPVLLEPIILQPRVKVAGRPPAPRRRR